MSDTATIEAPTVDSTQSEAPDLATENAAPAQPEKSGSKSKAHQAEALRKLLQREKDDPNVKFSDSELDILDKHYAGDLKPAKKTKTANPVSDESESSEPEENPVSEPKEDEAEDPEGQESDEADESEENEEAEAPDPDAESLMKEVGAKNLKEALAKVKDLRKQLGGKDAQAVARITRERDDLVKGASQLWGDVKKGNPDALAFVEKTFGFKAVPLGQSQQTQYQAQQPQNANGSFIDPEKFIDAESAELVNSAFSRMQQKLEALEAKAGEFDAERSRIQKEASLQSGTLAVIDEMVQVAQRMESLKGINNLREVIKGWYAEGKPDSRIDAFTELFDIAKEKGTDLEGAYLIKRGREADRLITEATEKGRKAAYGHKPNPSLSGNQGGKGETTYQPLSEQQIEAMSEDHTLMPGDWFDKDENPVQSKIPKKAWPIFGFR